MLKFTQKQIKALTSKQDFDSAKAILDLSLWSNLSATENALWGNFQGDNDEPSCQVATISSDAEQTTDAHPSIQWQCSCGSAIQPCKHAIALMLLSANKQSFQPCVDDALPNFVKQLLSPQQNALVVQSNNLESNLQNTLDGIKHLENFLKEIIQLGLERVVEQKQYYHFEAIATRLDLIQLPFVAMRVRLLGNLSSKNDEHSFVFVNECTELFRICQSFYNYAQFTTINSDIPCHLFNLQDKFTDAFEQNCVHDTWLFIHMYHYYEKDNLSQTALAKHTTFAYGCTTQQIVLLNFVVPEKSKDNFVDQGKTYVGTMYSPSTSTGIREAFFKPDNMSLSDFETMGANNPVNFEDVLAKLGDSWKTIGLADKSEVTCTIEQLLSKYNQHYQSSASNIDFVGVIHDVHLAYQLENGYEERFFLVDSKGQALKLNNSYYMDDDDLFQSYLTLNGFKPFSAFVKISRYTTYLLGVVCDGQFIYQKESEYLSYSKFSIYDTFNPNVSHPVIKNVLEQANLGTSSDILDYNLLDKSIQNDVKSIFDQATDKASAFLKATNILLPMYAGNKFNYSTDLTSEELAKLSKINPNVIYHALYVKSLKNAEIKSSDPLETKLQSPESITPIISSGEDKLPYFPNEVLELFNEYNNLIQEFEKSFRLLHDAFTLGHDISYWFIERLVSAGRQFSPLQCLYLINKDNFFINRQEQLKMYGDYVIYNPYQYLENLIRLCGDHLKLNFSYNYIIQSFEEKYIVFIQPKFRLQDNSLDYAQAFSYIVKPGHTHDNADGLLAMVRAQNPALARDILSANQDEILKDLTCNERKEAACTYIDVLNVHLSKDDEELLTSLYKKTSSTVVQEKILDTLRRIPNSQYSLKCKDLWNKYVKFDERKDEWSITPFEHNKSFTSLGILKEEECYYSQDESDLYMPLLSNLLEGMDWEQIKELTGATNSKEAVRRWAKFPANSGFARVLSIKIEQAVATEDALLAVRNTVLFRQNLFPVTALSSKMRLYYLKKAIQKEHFSTAIHPIFTLKREGDSLEYQLTDDANIIDFLISSIDTYYRISDLVLIFRAVTQDNMATVQEQLDSMACNNDLTYDGLQAVKRLQKALCFKQKVEDFLSRLK